ncbi:MAG: hypothetical protein FWE31_04120 [Firmicutes bacterium]|nr:hypothetical protein [Bacillota bacterium]
MEKNKSADIAARVMYGITDKKIGTGKVHKDIAKYSNPKYSMEDILSTLKNIGINLDTGMEKGA